MIMEDGLASLCLQAITMAITKHLQEATTLRASGNNNWYVYINLYSTIHILIVVVMEMQVETT